MEKVLGEKVLGKKVLGTHGTDHSHWVGDGFPVRTLFSYSSLGQQASPFLLLDYAGPATFEPAEKQRGVGEHPHRGFETVTLVYQGEVEHRDSTGAGGRIGPGDVQWMTAGAGILHEEFHSEAFTRRGGGFEAVQLWVNLPAKDKGAAPGYQTVLSTDIPQVDLPDGAGSMRVIAGEYRSNENTSVKGPARTFTPMDVWDLNLTAGRTAHLNLPAGRNVMVVVLRGAVQVNDEGRAREAQFVLLDRAGTEVRIKANQEQANHEAKVLVLSGAPIEEPIVGYGPFVMNTEAQIEQALTDFRSGRFGHMPVPMH